MNSKTLTTLFSAIVASALTACASQKPIPPSSPQTQASSTMTTGAETGPPSRNASCGTAKDCYEQGAAAHKAHDDAKALRLFQTACQLGHMHACFNQARLLPESQDDEAATLLVRVCRNAKDTKNTAMRTTACYVAGNLLFERDKAKALDMFEPACFPPNVLPPACKGGAVAALHTGQFKRARKLAEAGCNDKLKVACNVLGVLYLQGKGVDQDVSKARAYFTEACHGGDHDACDNLRTVENSSRGGVNQRADVPGANLHVKTLTVNKQSVRDVACRVVDGGAIGALAVPTKLVAAFALEKVAIRACTHGKDARVHFTMDGSRLSPKPVQGMNPAVSACLGRILANMHYSAKGECAMTLTFQ